MLCFTRYGSLQIVLSTQCYPKYIGGRSTTEYRKAVKPVCRLQTDIHQLKSQMTKCRGFMEFLHARKTHFSLWEKAAVYPYNNINLENLCDDV